MKFLLVAINAKYIHSNPAVYSLRAFAKEEWQENIEIAEYTINNRMEDILADIYKRKPDAVAISCYIWNWRLVQEILPELNKILPTVPIWLGGPEVSFDAGQILKDYPMLTGIMVGEGEVTFSTLLQYYNGHCSQENKLSDMDGIIYRDGTDIFVSKERTLTNMDDLPFLYSNLDAFENRIIYYESARGCPYRCSYCLSSIDKTVRFRNVETVKKELQFFLDNKVKQVKFIDRTFNCNHERTMEIWNYIHQNDNGVTNFHFEISADILQDKELELLKQMRPGLVQLEIGVQSTNADTLKEINRYADIDMIRKTVKKIQDGKNVHVHLDLIAGLPYEDYDSFKKSFNEVYEMEPQQLQLGFLKVLKGSPMQEKAGSYGINYTNQPPYEVLYSKWISYGQICKLKQIEEMVELYYNSCQFTHTLFVLAEVFDNPFELFEKLAEYYEEKGYFVNSPSRIYRYEVLLSFTRRYDKEHEELYKELLTYDIYLRENLKTRPEFSKDLSDYKEKIKAIYADKENRNKLIPEYKEYDERQAAKMTHIDVFSYAVWNEQAKKCREKLKIQTAVLFDYKKRNPLTNEAAVKIAEWINE